MSRLLGRAIGAMGAGDTDFSLDDTPAHRDLIHRMRYADGEKRERDVEVDEDGKIWVTDWRLLHYLAAQFDKDLEE